MNAFSSLVLLFLSTHTGSAAAMGDEDFSRDLSHRKRRHSSIRQGTLIKKDHLKDFRNSQTLPTQAPTLTLLQTSSPTDEPTKSPIFISAPTQQPIRESTFAPTLTPGNALESCRVYDSPPLGSSGMTMTGRIGRSFTNSSCVPTRPYPGTIGNEERYYELIGPFRNPSAGAACARVSVDLGNCGDSSLLFVAAFSEFDPVNQGNNYLGDIGWPERFSQFTFVVPAAGDFFVVGQQRLPLVLTNQNTGEGCVFSVSVDFQSYTSGPIEFPPLGSTGTTITGDLRGAFPTLCTDPPPSSALFRGDREVFVERLGPFRNPSASAECVTVIVDSGTCQRPENFPPGNAIKVAAYSNFTADDPTIGYLGQNGLNSNRAFEIPIAGNAEFYLVLLELRLTNAGFGIDGCTASVVIEIGRKECGLARSSSSL